MRLVVVSIVGLLAACTPSPEQRATDVCTAICDCMSGLPSEVQSCTTECTDEVTFTIPDACLDCVYTYSQTCSDLFATCFVDQGPCDIEDQQRLFGGMR